jgi:periplasmic protein CpxP/Spy
MRNMFAVLSIVMAVSLAAMVPVNAAPATPGGQSGPPPKEIGVSPSADRGPNEDIGPEQGLRRRHKGSVKSMLKTLGLTDEQKNEIKSLYTGFSDRVRKTGTDLMALKGERKTMLMTGKVDQQKLAQIDDQIVQLRSDLLREKLKLRRDRLAALTPEQIEKLAQWKATHAKSKGPHGGWRHGGHFVGRP